MKTSLFTFCLAAAALCQCARAQTVNNPAQSVSPGIINQEILHRNTDPRQAAPKIVPRMETPLKGDFEKKIIDLLKLARTSKGIKNLPKEDLETLAHEVEAALNIRKGNAPTRKLEAAEMAVPAKVGGFPYGSPPWRRKAGE